MQGGSQVLDTANSEIDVDLLDLLESDFGRKEVKEFVAKYKPKSL